MYYGYNKEIIDVCVDMGCDVSEVVAGFRLWGLSAHEGHFYEIREEDTKTVINTLLAADEWLSVFLSTVGISHKRGLFSAN